MSARTRQAKLLAVASASFVAFGAQADDLLIIDLSVPNLVTITGTAGLSSATVTGSDSIGVYMQNFYGVAGGALSTSSTGAGNLTNFGNPSDGSPALFRGGAGADPGLNIFSWSPDANVTFTAGTQGFTGSGSWALDAPEYADMIAGGNRSGNLFFPADTADDVANATLIGTYRVVIPAPATLPLLGIGLGLGAMRRRR